ENLLRKEAELAKAEGKRVLEIGPGDGRLTQALLERNPLRIYAIEKDERLIETLQDKFCCYGEKVVIIQGDILEAELPDFEVVAGNIPYYISSDIIFMLAKHKFENGVLMVQKEFALKMVAKPGEKNYGRLSVTSQLAFDIKLARIVPKPLFKPVPKVDSAIILLKPTGIRLTEFQENIIRWLFQHRNKTARNALTDSKKFTKEQLAVLGKFEKRRVRTLSKEECLEIAKLLHSENSTAL
ncbi:TPA: ribosomal RNA small subunit methyltransferase A, partial [Candidatus Micrarchaeota archaeon]|nr:ribosomal RNA small subunit methyltransferase A [Candidatus Micrarchaeota archaeon]